MTFEKHHADVIMAYLFFVYAAEAQSERISWLEGNLIVK
jgi:hypothetical protein